MKQRPLKDLTARGVKKEQHLKLMCARFMAAAIIIAAMPLAHLWFGQDPASAGVAEPQAYAMLIVFAGIGAIVACVYVIVASLVHLTMRNRFRFVFWTDVVLGLAAFYLVVSMGVFARYTD